MEELVELKRKILKKVEYSETFSKETMDIIKETFEELKGKYKELQCDSATIEEYITGEYNETEKYITDKVSTKRKTKQIEQIKDVLSKIEKNLEKNEKVEENKKTDHNNIEKIEEIKSNANNDKTMILNAVEDKLKNIQLTQNRILGARGWSQERIDFISEEVRKFIKKSNIKNEEKIIKILEKDDENLKAYLVDSYNAYREENKTTKREEFANKYDVKETLTLEEQQKIASEFKEKAKEEGEQKSGEKLPDDILM